MIQLVALMGYVGEVANDNVAVLLFSMLVNHKILLFNKTHTE